MHFQNPSMGSHGCKVWRRCPHSHTHHQIPDYSNTPLHHFPHSPLHLLHHRHCPHCPLHYHHFHHNFQSLQCFTPLPQNPYLFGPLPIGTQPISGAVDYNEANANDSQISQELEHIELDDEEEDDDPVFVLTDEWREFFAKSEARRKLVEQVIQVFILSGSLDSSNLLLSPNPLKHRRSSKRRIKARRERSKYRKKRF